MSVYNPPTETLPIFDPSVFIKNTEALTADIADLRYLRFPFAQGAENLQSTTINGSLTINNNDVVITDGTTTNTINKNGYTTTSSSANLTHYLNFSNSSSSGIGAIQKSVNLSVNPSTGTLNTLGLITATGGLTTPANITTTGTGTMTSAGRITASNGLTLSAGTLVLPANSIANTALPTAISQTTLSASTSITTTGTGTITSAGLLTASNGLTLTGTLTLPTNSIANTALPNNISVSGSLSTTGTGTISSAGLLTTSSSISNTGTIATSDSNNNMVILDKNVSAYTGRRIMSIGFIGSGLSTDYGFIQPVEAGLINRNLSLNPNGGNVGVGTTNPTSKLEVAGAISSQGSITSLSGTLTGQTIIATTQLTAEKIICNTTIYSAGAISTPNYIYSQNSGFGYVGLKQSGLNNETGYIEFYANGGNPLAYIGYIDYNNGTQQATGRLQLKCQNGTTGINLDGASNVSTGLFTCNNGINVSGTFNAFGDFNSAKDIFINGLRFGVGLGSSQTNLACGIYCLGSNTTGIYLTAVGGGALTANQTGNHNTGVGYLSLYKNISASYNTGCGYATLQENLAEHNTAVGFQSLITNTTGTQNTAVGSQSLQSNYTGNQNTAVGFLALHNNRANDNTAVGRASSFATTTGIENTSVGTNSLYTNSTGNYNCAFGVGALQNSTIASNNVAIGRTALYLNSTGVNNVAIGRDALYNNTTFNNVAIGINSLRANTGGYNNTAVGTDSLQTNVVGFANVAVGASSLNNNVSTANVAVGPNACYYNSSGTANTAIGYIALQNNVSGNNNTAVGYNSFQANGFSNSTSIGCNSNPTASSQIMLGTSSEYVVCAGGLTIGNSNNITLSTNPNLPTSTQLGYTIYSAVAGTITDNTQYSIASIGMNPAGTYMISYNIKFYSSTTTTIYELATGMAGTTDFLYGVQGWSLAGSTNGNNTPIANTTGRMSMSGSDVVRITNIADVINLNVFCRSFNSPQITYTGNIKAVRIA